MHPEPVEVVVGILTDKLGRVLVNERPPGKPRAGAWEFPGGKCEPGEVPRDALVRELREELGIELRTATRYFVLTHAYADDARPVRLDCWRVTHWSGEPKGMDGQALRWCRPDELPALQLLDADRPLMHALMLPPLFVREPSAERLRQRLKARAGRPAPGRVAWLADGDEALPEPAPGDRVGSLSPVAGRPYREVRLQGTPALPWGAAVDDEAAAREARDAGAAFLLLLPKAAPVALVRSIGLLGLPYYVNIAGDARQPPPPRELIVPLPQPTGQLWWPASD